LFRNLPRPKSFQHRRCSFILSGLPYAEETTGVEGIKNVKDPKRVRDAILHQMEAYRGKQIQEQAEAIAKNLVERQQR